MTIRFMDAERSARVIPIRQMKQWRELRSRAAKKRYAKQEQARKTRMRHERKARRAETVKALGEQIVQQVISEHGQGVKAYELREYKGSHRFVGLRVLCFWMMRDHGMTFDEIGGFFGMDRTTVKHAITRNSPADVWVRLGTPTWSIQGKQVTYSG